MTERLYCLTEQHLAGELTRAEEKELHQLLSENSENREIFSSQGLIDGRLRWEMKNTSSLLAAPQGHKRRAATKKWMALAALLTLSLVTGVVIRSQHGAVDSQSNTETAANTSDAILPPRTVARLTSEKGARWQIDDAQQTPSSGFWFKPGEWNLTHGSATMTLDSGAKITLAAPASVELINSNHARLSNGTVSVNVPESAIGFTLDTPKGRVIDLSTEFSVSVEKGDHDEVHVLEGEVIVQYGDKNQQSKLIGEESAIQLSMSGSSPRLSPAQFRAGSYPLEADYEPLAQSSLRDVGFVHWSFDTLDKNGTFASDGTLDRANTCSAQVVIAPMSSSLKPIKGVFSNALHLNGDGTWLETQFPGIAGSTARTIAFWVRVPPQALDSQAYSVIGWGHAEPHGLAQKWEIGWNTGEFPIQGTGVKGAVRTDFGSGHTIGFTDLRDGRWHHVVSVFTGGEHSDVATHIRHYVDGQLEGYSAYRQQAIDTEIDTAKSIPAVIGKYLHPTDKQFGTFHGSIDELYVFNAALTPSQILQLQHTNTPPASGELLPSLKP